MIKHIPPSIYNAYNICPRQAWLMSRQLTADQHNEFLEIGRLIDNTTFEKEKKKIYIPDLNAMVDVIFKQDGIFFIGEIKKSSNTLKSGISQLKYYLYLLKKKGIDQKGVIKIPQEKKSVIIELTNNDIEEIEKKLKLIKTTLNADKPPEIKKIPFCKKCAHYEFCWS